MVTQTTSSIPRTMHAITNPIVVLHNVAWSAYEQLGELLRDRPNLQLTYRKGCLEITTLSLEHERIKKLLARIIDLLTEELDVSYIACGSTTYKQAAAEHGLEPDECYYLENHTRIQGLRRIDLDRDPPPDFVLEIDVTNRSLNRLPIYAEMGVHEIWIWHHDTVRSLRLEDGQYREYETSSLLTPDFPLAELTPFIEIGLNENNLAMARRFRAWFRQYLADHGLTS